MIQRNLVFVVGLSPRLADPETLRKTEYFGKYGRIFKVVINNHTVYNGTQVHTIYTGVCKSLLSPLCCVFLPGSWSYYFVTMQLVYPRFNFLTPALGINKDRCNLLILTF